MKKVIVSSILMVICIVAAVLLRGSMDNAELDYEEVQVMVLSSETKNTVVKTGYSRSNLTTYEITVSYGGKEYELKNAHDSYSYRKGSMVKAYLSHGKMYANLEGVRSSTPEGIAYFVALIGAFAMFIITMILLTKVGKKKPQGSNG